MRVEWIITSSVLIAVIIALRYLLKGRISLRLQYALWGLVLVRLLLPVSIGRTAVSVLNAVPAVSGDMVLGRSAQMNVTVDGTTAVYELPRQQTEYEAAREELTHTDRDWSVGGTEHKTVITADTFTALWLAGTAVTGVWFAAVNAALTVRLRRGRRKLDRPACPLPVYITGAVETPCLFGLFRPAVYVTEEAAEDETVLRHVIEHETTHYRHGDHIWSALRGAALAVHWFNPLVWWGAFLSRRDG